MTVLPSYRNQSRENTLILNTHLDKTASWRSVPNKISLSETMSLLSFSILFFLKKVPQNQASRWFEKLPSKEFFNKIIQLSNCFKVFAIDCTQTNKITTLNIFALVKLNPNYLVRWENLFCLEMLGLYVT